MTSDLYFNFLWNDLLIRIQKTLFNTDIIIEYITRSLLTTPLIQIIKIPCRAVEGVFEQKETPPRSGTLKTLKASRSQFEMDLLVLGVLVRTIRANRAEKIKRDKAGSVADIVISSPWCPSVLSNIVLGTELCVLVRVGAVLSESVTSCGSAQGATQDVMWLKLAGSVNF